MSEVQVYLWLMLDNVNATFAILAILSGVAALTIGIISGVARMDAYDDEDRKSANNKFKIFFRFLFWLVIPSWIICTVTPDSKQYAMIKVIPKMANSQLASDIQKDIPEMYAMAKDALKEMIAPKKETK